MKYAIVESGGKQYRAVEGETIEVDRLQLEEGSEVELESVLLIANDGEFAIGTPMLDGAKIKATVLNQFKGRKIRVFKYKSGTNYRRTQGHRQKYTRLLVNEIISG
jgi:large subunit ribosomal protein L21